MSHKIFAVIPVKRFESSKSRLKFWLTDQSRVKLAELLLIDTLTTLTKSTTIDTIVVVSGDERAKYVCAKVGTKFLRQDIDNGVNDAVIAADAFSIKNGADATIIVPSDLPLLQPENIDLVAKASEYCEKCIVICPSLRHDGTNILLRKPINLIKTYYDDNSYARHIQEAVQINARIFAMLSDNVIIDLDTIHDVKMLARFDSNNSTALEFLKEITTR
ncbi:MAG TPA: 2-phospho-L-lactate guanylyltransferase [Nitrososphaeraceae archaeon]